MAMEVDEGTKAADDLELVFHERGAWCDEASSGMYVKTTSSNLYP